MPLPGVRLAFFLPRPPNPLKESTISFFLSLYFISQFEIPPLIFFIFLGFDVEPKKSLTFFKAAPDCTRDIFRARFRFDPVIPGLI